MTIGRAVDWATAVFNYSGIIKGVFPDVEAFMFTCFIAGLIGIYVYYPLRYQLLRRAVKKQRDRLKDVAIELSKIFSKNLGKEIKLHDLRLNVRKFTIRPFYKKHIKYWFKTSKVYCQVNNYDFLNKEGNSENFSFQVSPIQRGLVGVAYAKKCIMYDDKLTERMEKYNLNNNHKNNNVIANTDFAIVKPFVNKNDKVKSIIAFDTEQDVSIPDEKRKDVERLMLYYSDLFGKLLIKI